MNVLTPYNATVILEPDADDAHRFPEGTTGHIELKILADNRHAAVSLLRAFGGPLQGDLLTDWIGDTTDMSPTEWEAAYEKVHFPHIELKAAASHGSDECEVTITAPSIAMAHHTLRLAAMPIFDEQILQGGPSEEHAPV